MFHIAFPLQPGHRHSRPTLGDITTLRKMLKAGDPVDIKLWTKSGEIQEWRNCVPLRYNFYQGTRQMKLLDSRQIRQVRDVCIFEINGLEVFILKSKRGKSTRSRG